MENKCRKITSLGRLDSHSEGVELNYQSTLKVWAIVKGGKFFYFLPSCYFIFIHHLTFHALSNSDTSTSPTHAMPSWFELHKFASRIYLLANLLPCVIAIYIMHRLPWKLHLLTPGCSGLPCVFLFRSHVHLCPWVLSFSCCGLASNIQY